MTKNSTSWQNKVARSGAAEPQTEETMATIVLVRGEDMQGQPQWAYALIPADNYMAFREAEAAGAYQLAEYGEVLHMGQGAEPPDALKRQMAEEYGCNPHFEDEMQALLSEAFEHMPDLSSLLDDDAQ